MKVFQLKTLPNNYMYFNKLKFLIFAIFLFPTILNSADSDYKLVKENWPFDGFFGRFDYSSIQRGLQVYREVCAGCHGLKYVSYRDLSTIGYDDEEIKSIASEYEIIDGPNDEGEMFERFAKPSDKFVGPYENDQVARLSNNGAYPPDLSLITKARKGGANYIYNLLNGYKEPPKNYEIGDGMYYNLVYPGNQIAMPTPIYDDSVEYSDGTVASQDQIIRDVTSFLVWAAEPELEKRKSLGIKVLSFLILITLMLLAVKRKIWKDIE
ncbi:MAG: cytochrome c1 [Rickettsiales bacterium TMED127]|nr:MAG: cytochrome c1 [Rickettsiales bacterium TMED127]|tara:strand:- start:8399 stop:9199 length:801 start_codon:yes stop_codon:yes gene_type:complete